MPAKVVSVPNTDSLSLDNIMRWHLVQRLLQGLIVLIFFHLVEGVPAQSSGLSWTYQSATDVPMQSTTCGGTLDLALSFQPTPGQNLMVVNNASGYFLSGQFSNVPNGGSVDLTYGGRIFSYVAWYYGGDGNDLELIWKQTGLASWGYNGFGGLGVGSTTISFLPLRVDTSGGLNGKTIVQISRSSNHSMALCSDGSIFAWGDNIYGQLGDGTTVQRSLPVQVNADIGVSALFGKQVVAVSAAYYHNLALCSDGSIVAWGYNANGRLGDASTINTSFPVAVNAQTGLSALAGKIVRSIATGRDHNVALCTDGSVVTWGSNGFGQLGDGSTVSRSVPVSVITTGSFLAGKTVIRVSTGGNHTFALCSDGSVAAWGDNGSGQLGDGSMTVRSTAVALNQSSSGNALIGRTLQFVTGGTSHSLGLCTDGSVVAWGLNTNSQLGDGSATQRLAPTQVTGLIGSGGAAGKRAVQVAAGSNDSRALLADGTIVTWGVNNAGEVGDGKTGVRSVPAPYSANAGGRVLAERFVSTMGEGISGQHNVAVYGLNATPPVVVTGTTGMISTTTVEIAGEVLGSGSSPVTERGIVWSTSPNPDIFYNRKLSAIAAGAGAFSVALQGLPSNTVIYARAYAINGEISYGDEINFSTLAAPLLNLSGTYNSETDVPLTTDSVNLTGGILDLTLNFAPAPGTNLTVIRKTSRGFISGQFANAANGATIELSHNGIPYPFVVWYYGGDGNDLVLLWPYTGVAAWGLNASGQLGDFSIQQRNSAIAVDNSGILLGKTVVQVAIGGNHTLALCSDGSLLAWGANGSGQLGDNSTHNHPYPVIVDVTPGISAIANKQVVSVAAGNSSNVALCSDGTLVTWGAGVLVPTAVTTDKKIVGIASGYSHRLALCLDGTVAAWGGNANGQLGDATTANAVDPVPVSFVDGLSALAAKSVRSLAAGRDHSLALCDDGSVVAWGGNTSGQLGNGLVQDSSIPIAVSQTPGLSALAGRSVIAVTAGNEHSLALTSNGNVGAWGRNTYGQLGDNSTIQRNYPTLVNITDGMSAISGKRVVSLSAGFFHSLAFCADGSIASWGYNTNGGLGDNSTTQRLVPTAINVANGISVLAGRSNVAISTGFGGYHSAAIYALNRRPGVISLQPSLISSSSAYLSGEVTSAGDAPVTERGVVWSSNQNPTIANFKMSSGSGTGAFGVTVNNLTTWTTFYARSYATTSEGTSYGEEVSFTTLKADVGTLTWNYLNADEIPLTAEGVDLTGESLNLTLGFDPPVGTNLTVIRKTGLGFITGQFGNAPHGSTINLNYNGATYSFIAWYYGGDGNDLVLLWPYNAVSAWGRNNQGQLGDSTLIDRMVPVAVDATLDLHGKTVVQLAHGESHSLALCSDGSIMAWGDNNSGQLGNRSTLDRSIPFRVDQTSTGSALRGKTVVAVAAGSNYSLAVCSDGTMATWGNNQEGQLGNGTTTNSSTPVSVKLPPGRSVVSAAGGFYFTLALCSDGSLLSWGSNFAGQLGDITNQDSLVPVEVAAKAFSGKPMAAVGCGSAYSIALDFEGKIWSWGSNSSGQLGDNSTTNRGTPGRVDPTGLSALAGRSVTSTHCGSSHIYARCSDGTLASWGMNSSGQLGDNTTTNRKLPVLVNTTAGTSALAGKIVTTVAAGAYHGLARCNDGTIATWGDNTYGQLGDNTKTNRRVPVTLNTIPGASALAGRPVTAFSSGAIATHLLATYALTTPPTVQTGSFQDVTLHSAILQGSVLTEGGSPVIERGFLWSTTPNPNIYSPKISVGTGAGTFTAARSDLISNTTYFFCTYARNSDGLVYGEQNKFTTPAEPVSGLSWIYNSAEDVPLNLASASVTGNLSLNLNFKPKPGINLTVIRNTGPDFIHGEFANARHGSTLNLSFNGIEYPFIIWYYGGSGNDLLLLWPHTGLVAWGQNTYGQLGDNSTTNRNVPVAVDQSGILRGKTIVQIARGLSHAVALCSDHTLVAWGDNGQGQLGNNTKIKTSVPTLVDTTALGGKKVISVSAGDYYSLALCSDGSVASWGRNFGGDGGDSSVVRLAPTLLIQNDPTSALSQQSIVAISAGSTHCLALTAEGMVAGWGANSTGQLGNEIYYPSSLPVWVNTRSGVSVLSSRKVAAISASRNFSLALCEDGGAVAWGSNNNGQLGDNSSTARFGPVEVNAASGISLLYGKNIGTISAGSYHSLALCTDGTALAWGHNYTGSLGDNATTEREAPVAINVTSGSSALAGKKITALLGGSQHSIALCSDGSVAAWGLNNNGQLGDGTFQQRNTAVNVTTLSGGGVLANRHVSSLGEGGAGSNTVAIYGLTPLEGWRQQYFGSIFDTQTSASTADPDADGIPNLVEYAFDLDPLTPSALANLPEMQFVAGNLTWEFTPPPGRSGIVYGAEWSDTLLSGSWTSIVDTGTNLSHKFILPVGPSTKKFYRLTVITD